ncbi:MAG: substrate-binding domain-containing protein [Clostridia bacterium]
MSRRLAAFALLAVFLCAMALMILPEVPINTGANEGRRFLVGMSQANLVEPWRVIMNREVEVEAAKYPDMRVIFTDATQDSSRQIEDVRMLMGYGVDLLIISPNDSEALRPVISEAYEHIPVIVLDRDVGEGKCTLFIGPDNYRIGQLAGLRVGKLLGEKGGNVLEMLGSMDSPPVAARSAGFADGIKRYPNVKIITSLVADWLEDRAVDRFKEYAIIADQPIDVVFGQNDAMAYGAYIAARELRVPGVRFVGVDGLRGEGGGIDLVQRGILEATISCGTGGEQAVSYAMRILNGETNLPASIILKPTEITRETLKEIERGNARESAFARG